MTHTLSRKGLSEERPGEEMVVLCMVHGKQKASKMEAMRAMARTVLRHHPANVIGAPLGFSENDIVEIAAAAGIATAVFYDKGVVIKLIREIQAQDLGISVVLSGLFSDIRDVCRECGLKEHTFNITLGIYGKTEKLPDSESLEITTQCGHGLISPFLVKHVLKKLKKDAITAEEAARILIQPCVCGIGNPRRVSTILNTMADGGGAHRSRVVVKAPKP
jgi:hypothetical protein